MSISRREEQKNQKKELANLSAKGQEFLRKQGVGRLDIANRTLGDDTFQQSLLGATTTASQDQERTKYNSMHQSVFSGNGFQLPNIGKGSPFKGFLDISIVHQKMRKEMNTADGNGRSSGMAQFEFGVGASQKSNRRGGSKPLKDNLMQSQTIDMTKVQPKGTRFQSKDRQVQMSAKVLETWINETLQDAEHLDIPGVILKPEHQNPISRYGIEKLILVTAGIPTDMIDRIYRSLFVYSVGFYELIKSCLQHTAKKYSIITNIWKVFAILLEYCCRTDYRMLISEISKEHKVQLEQLDRDYQKKSEEQANNEKILKENLDTQQKMVEELQREMLNERQMRLKLEEDFTQNTKNHEEEVQLRLKFESKLNNMHSAHRDLETKYKRILQDLTNSQKTIKMQNERLVQRTDEITSLKTTQAENETDIAQKKEEIESARRELAIKGRQLKENDIRTQQIQDSLDLFRYKVQDSQKENTEYKLKMDVFQSTCDGLNSEKKHLTLELKETKELLHIYEEKTKQLMEDLQNTTGELQVNKREMIGFNEINREREEKIITLKKDLMTYKLKADEYEIKLGTLQINYDKVDEQLTQTRADHDDLVDKLHAMNKARHEIETKLQDEHDRNKNLSDVVNLKDELLDKRENDIQDLDKRVNELIQAQATLDAQKMGVEKAFELSKSQLGDRIKSLNEVITNEKETRELWIQRYEDEQKNHTNTNSSLLNSRSELKDQVLGLKNCEIKLNSAQRQIQILQEQNLKFQHQVNEAVARAENLDRELNTQKEILKQMEMTKKEYIGRLKKELDTIELRYQHLLNENCMIGEDFRSQAHGNLLATGELQIEIQLLKNEIKDLNQKMDDKDLELVVKDREIETFMMESEEHLTLFDCKRSECEKFKQLFEKATIIAQERKLALEETIQNHEKMQLERLEGRKDFGQQANIMVKKPIQAAVDMSSRSSGSGMQSSSTKREMGRGKRVGGGGMIAGKPPITRSRNADSVTTSKQGLAVDTASQGSRHGGMSQHNRSAIGAQVRSNDSQEKSQMNDDGMPTPRNLQGRNQPGSGTLPDAGKRSMDGVNSAAKTQEGQAMLEHVQSATQSQQFKTLDNSKTQLHDETQNINVRKSLATSQSDKISQGINSPGIEKVDGNSSNPEQLRIDSGDLNLLKEASDANIPLSNEVIEEQDEHDEEERKTRIEAPFVKMGQFIKNISQDKSAAISTFQGSQGGVSNSNIVRNSSQSRAKVNLSQHGGDQDKDTLVAANVGGMQDSRPTLNNEYQQHHTQPFQSDGSTPHQAPMQEMNQMEVQFNNPSQQAALIAEQQRVNAIQNEINRQNEIKRLQQQAHKKATGNTNIRKLIKSAATRD